MYLLVSTKRLMSITLPLCRSVVQDVVPSHVHVYTHIRLGFLPRAVGEAACFFSVYVSPYRVLTTLGLIVDVSEVSPVIIPPQHGDPQLPRAFFCRVKYPTPLYAPAATSVASLPTVRLPALVRFHLQA